MSPRFCSALIVLLAAVPALRVGASDGDRVVATIDGIAVTRARLDAEIGARRIHLLAEENRIRRRVLEDLLDTRILAAEAARRAMTVAELVRTEVSAKTTAPTFDEVTLLLAESSRNDDTARTAVSKRLLRRREGERRAAYLGGLRREYNAVVAIPPFRVPIDAEARHSLGPPDAAVNIVVFSDFSCPFCRRAADILREAQRTDQGRVRLIYRHYPLPGHSAAAAAAATECVPLSKFWEMHDRLFGSQRDFGRERLDRDATAIGLDARKFADCVASSAVQAVLARDIRAAAVAGVTGVPAIFVNGRPVDQVTVETIKALVEEELASSRAIQQSSKGE